MRTTLMLRVGRTLTVIAIIVVASLPHAFAQAADDIESRNQETWRKAITRTAVPAEGCFHASYPSLTWSRTECTIAPDIPFRPRKGQMGETVGNGNDYAAKVSSGLISETVGTFPNVSGVTTETGTLGANDYSLQINSNVFSTPACNGALIPPLCQGWEQFVYSSGYDKAYVQYWLLDWNTNCPSGWTPDGNGCYMNSASVKVSQIPVTELNTLSLAGSALIGPGSDSLVFTVGSEAYSTTGLDSVLDLAAAWTESEFNIVGDGAGSAATFNSGSSLTVMVEVFSGTQDAPLCEANAGTTGETNNLNLGSCTSAGGATPYIEFTESNSLLTENPATNITPSSAYLSGTVNPQGDSGNVYFQYGTTPTTLTNYGCNNGNSNYCVVVANSKAQPFNFTPTGLTGGTTYYFQIVFQDNDNGNLSYGAVMSFTTKTPVLTESKATNITPSSAYLSGTVNPQGDSGNVYFQYGTTPTTLTNYGCNNGNSNYCVVVANSKAQPFNFTPTGLTGGTTYYFQIVFQDNDNGNLSYGAVMSFTTKTPLLTEKAATNVTASSAYVSGTVNPEGDDGYVYFAYGTSPTRSGRNLLRRGGP